MPAWISDLATGEVLTALAVLIFLGWGAAKAWRPIVRVVRFLDALIGTDERDSDGNLRHPGLLDRVGGLETDVRTIHHEVTPNSGGSIKDAVGRIEGMQREQGGVLNAHLEEAKRARIRQQETADALEELAASLAPLTDD